MDRLNKVSHTSTAEAFAEGQMCFQPWHGAQKTCWRDRKSSNDPGRSIDGYTRTQEAESSLNWARLRVRTMTASEGENQINSICNLKMNDTMNKSNYNDLLSEEIRVNT